MGKGRAHNVEDRWRCSGRGGVSCLARVSESEKMDSDRGQRLLHPDPLLLCDTNMMSTVMEIDGVERIWSFPITTTLS